MACTTHHNACECREAYFKLITEERNNLNRWWEEARAERDRYREALEQIAGAHNGSRAVEHLSTIARLALSRQSYQGERTKMQCAARGCDGCLVCEPEKHDSDAYVSGADCKGQGCAYCKPKQSSKDNPK